MLAEKRKEKAESKIFPPFISEFIIINSNGMEDDWNQSYQRIKAKHDEAYYAVEQAIQLEENGKPAQALAQYKLGIALIDDALITPVALPDDEDNTLDETWRQALKMIHKMKRSRADVVLRAGTLSNQLDPKDEASVRTEPNHSGVDGRPRTFSELGESLKNLQYNVDDIPNSLELLFLCDGVKLYHIAASGEVTTADESSTLRIVRLEKDIVQHLQATYFMQIIRSSVATPLVEESASDEENEDVAGAVGACSAGAAALATQNTPGRENSDSSLIYPLVPGASPCYLTDYGAFIFPDLESTVAGAAIGLLIPDESAEVALEILEAILHGVVKQARPNLAEWDDIPTGQYRPTRHISERISSGIVLGAGHISNGLVKGSEKVGEFVTYSTPYIISKLNRAPENAPPVSDCVINGVEMAKTATGVAVNVTGYIAGKVGSATMALGKFLAPHVQCQGSKLLTKTGMSADKAAETVSYLGQNKYFN